MGTPSAARHRDLEQRFRDLESEVRRLRTAVLTRRALVPSGVGASSTATASASAFPVAASLATVASLTLTVPAGATGYTLLVSRHLRVVNTGAAEAVLSLSASSSVSVRVGATADLTRVTVSEASGLAPGTTLTIDLQASTSQAGGWASHASNAGHVDALVTWR